MGQKTNPIGLRLGINRTWNSRWFANKGDYGKLLHQDLAIRKLLEKELKAANISRIVIERPHKKCGITIHAGRPGLIIGKKGSDIERMRKKISEMTQGDVSLNIVEIRKPEIDANIVAQSIAQQLERRVAFRRAMKRAVQSAIRLGAKGIRINCGGRLGGAEIARLEWYREGRVPLHTLRADIDYGRAEADTAYGICGIKVWIFKGEILEHDPMASERKHIEGQETGKGRSQRPDQLIHPKGAAPEQPKSSPLDGINSGINDEPAYVIESAKGARDANSGGGDSVASDSGGGDLPERSF